MLIAKLKCCKEHRLSYTLRESTIEQNARKHRLSIVDLDPEMDSQIEHLAGLIAGSYGITDGILEAARDAAEAQVKF